jgi:hypothetical protein
MRNQADRDAQRARAREEAEEAVQREARLASLSPEERAYETFIASLPDWTAAARDILKTEEPERSYILRYFRSEPGQAVIAAWPKNEKAKKRKADLKEAGL